MKAHTSFPSAQSLGDISRFLRDGGANDESRQLRASLGALAERIEAAVRTRRLRHDTAAITRTAAACVAARAAVVAAAENMNAL